VGEIPNSSNFHSSLYTLLSREQVAELYHRHGWQIRKCSWTDYEARCPFAEVVIESEDPILMHGSVADITANLAKILAPLGVAEIRCSWECYDENGELILQHQSSDS